MTINLEQAKTLHKLGVRKECEKSWAHWELTNESSLFLTSSCKGMRFKEGKTYEAYSAEELVGMIKGDLEIVRSEEGTYYTFCQMKDSDGIEFYGQVHGATLTEALANKLIHDLENGIVSLDEVNK